MVQRAQVEFLIFLKLLQLFNFHWIFLQLNIKQSNNQSIHILTLLKIFSDFSKILTYDES